MSEKPISEVVKEIVEAGVAAGQDDDEMLIAIVQAGVKFKQAGKLFNQAMIDGNYRVSSKDRKAAIREILVAADFNPETYAEVDAMLIRITEGDKENDLEAVADTVTSQAMQGMRAYAKEFEVVIPKPEKKASGGFKTVVQDAVVANPNLTQAEFEDLCTENKKDVEKCVKRMYPMVQFAQEVAKAALENAAKLDQAA